MSFSTSVDSRAYSFAYIIREREGLPADFEDQIAQQFDQGIFLPRELAGRFDIPRFPPRVVLLDATSITIHWHPSQDTAPVCILFEEIVYVEIQSFLLDCMLRIVTKEFTCDIPFAARDSKRVDELLSWIREGLCQRLPAFGSHEYEDSRDPRLNAKFNGAEKVIIYPGERIIARLYSAPYCQEKNWFFYSSQSWTPGNDLLSTNLRLIWITEEQHGFRQEYGYRIFYTPLTNARRIRLDSGKRPSVEVLLCGNRSWQVPVAVEEKVAERFVSTVSRQLMLLGRDES